MLKNWGTTVGSKIRFKAGFTLTCSGIEQPIHLNRPPYMGKTPQRCSKTFCSIQCGAFLLPHHKTHGKRVSATHTWSAINVCSAFLKCAAQYALFLEPKSKFPVALLLGWGNQVSFSSLSCWLKFQSSLCTALLN